MSDETPTFTFSRVMVELGISEEEDSAIETAGALAAAMRAEIFGLFIEEESLLDLSGLPFASAFLPGGSRPQALDPELMRRMFERRARAGRKALSTYAEAAKIAWSFDTARGHGATTLGARVCGTDLVVLQHHAVGQTRRELMRLARAAAATACGVVVVARRSGRRTGPIIAIDVGDPAGSESVSLAGRLASAMEVPAMVFVLVGDEASARRIEARDMALLGSGAHVAGMRTFAATDFASLEAELHRMAPRLVIAGLDVEPFCNDEAAASLMRAAGAPIVLIRVRSGA